MSNEEWNFEDSRKADFDTGQVIEIIKPFYESVSEKNLHLLHHGTFNVYEVDKYIFRIPDATLFNKKGFDLIKKEIKKLNFLGGKLSVKIPEPLFVSDNPNLPLVGYEKIEGSSIEKIWKYIPQNNKHRLASQIGFFLKELHDPLLAKAYSLNFNQEGFTYLTIKRNYEDIFKKTQELIFPLISLDLKKNIENLFLKYFSDFDNYQFSVCLAHQDFDTSNILISEDNFEITGVIDFEDTSIGDPAYDLIFWTQGEKFQHTLLKSYNGNSDSFLDSRINFYFKRTGVSYMLYGIEHNLPDMTEYGKMMLQKRNS